LNRLLITGATGFIGGFLVEEAVKQGYEVIVSKRKNSDVSQINHLPITFVELDLSSVEQMRSILSKVKPDFVINNAGLTKSKHQSELNKINAEYAEHLAIAAMQSVPDLKKYVYISSLASYGPADTKNADVIIDAHDPQPVTMYGISKLLAEKKLKNIDRLPYIILRPTAVYGPREKDLYTVFKMVNNGLALYSGNGKQKLTFVYIDDLVQFILAVCKIEVSQKSYFVCDGKNYTSIELNKFIATSLCKKTVKFGLPLPILTLVATVSELVGKISGKVPPLNLDKLNEIKANNWQCDVETLIKDTGYKPQTFLEEGIAKTVKWYKNNNWL
jgi:nucleoside-diphosphate-sugar epimerase